MNAYVILVIPEASLGRISGEAYTNLAAAQEFIESRSGNPRKISEYIYRDDDETSYLIFNVKVVERSNG